MKNTAAAFATLLLGMGISAGALAWHGHPHVGVVIGPYWGSWYDPPPYYPPVVVERAEPPMYIEHQEARSAVGAPRGSNDWYYCRAAKAYYPYVKTCPSGWQRVSPRPPDQP
jgi:hypothetical protein